MKYWDLDSVVKNRFKKSPRKIGNIMAFIMVKTVVRFSSFLITMSNTKLMIDSTTVRR